MALSTANKSVGLEIDTGTVRAVEASGSAAKPKLLNMAEEKLPEGSVDEGMVVNPQEVGAALRELWSSGGISSRRILLGISNQGVLVRYATIPKVPDDKLANVLRYHAQEHLPIPLESVVLDHVVIGETADEDGNKLLEVLLVAARRDMLEGFLEALELASLEPVDIDVSTLSLMHILPPAALDRTVAVVNVANGLSNILISDRGQPRLARLVSVKLSDLSSRIGCSLDEVIKYSEDGSTAVREAYTIWAKSLIAETRSSLTYYQNQSGSSNLEAVIINGRGGRLSGITARLEEVLGIPVRLVNPFAGFSNAAKISEGSGIRAVEFAICAGLARRGLEGS